MEASVRTYLEGRNLALPAPPKQCGPGNTKHVRSNGTGKLLRNSANDHPTLSRYQGESVEQRLLNAGGQLGLPPTGTTKNKGCALKRLKLLDLAHRSLGNINPRKNSGTHDQPPPNEPSTETSPT